MGKEGRNQVELCHPHRVLVSTASAPHALLHSTHRECAHDQSREFLVRMNLVGHSYPNRDEQVVGMGGVVGIEGKKGESQKVRESESVRVRVRVWSISYP